MTEFINLCFLPSYKVAQSLKHDYVYAKYQFSRHMESMDFCPSTFSPINCSLNTEQVQCYKKIIPFLNKEIWNYRLMLTIKHFSTQLSTEIKILSPKGQVLKVTSQYHKTFLYRNFLQKNTFITPKINPQTGQISLSCTFLSLQYTQLNQYENVVSNLIASIQQIQDHIAQIINLVQNRSQKNTFDQTQSNHLKVSTFLRICSKKSNKQNINPFQNSQTLQTRKQVKCLTYGGNSDTTNSSKRPQRIKQLNHYLNNPLQTIKEIWEYEHFGMSSSAFKDQIKTILKNVQHSMIRTNTPLKNYQVMKLPQNHIEHLINSIATMREQGKSKRITKIEKNGFGKVTVQVQLHRISTVQKTYHFLSTLPPQVQLSFVNNYFSCNDLLQKQQGTDVIIQLAIRRQQLLSYLQSNSKCISFSTKLRILSQLISSAHLLEYKCSTMMKKVEMENFFIAKNMMVKIQNLKYLKYLNEEEKQEFQHSIKMGFVENQVSISRIYSKIFYQKDLIYFKPTQNLNRLRLSHVLGNSRHQEKEIIVDKIYEECGLYGPKNLMTLLTGLFLPYIPTMSYEQIKQYSPCKNLKYGIASLIKILENIS